MSDLYGDVGRGGEELVEEDARFLCSVGALPRDRRAHVDDDGHVMFVGGLEDTAQLCDVLRIIEIDVGVSEVHLEAGTQDGVAGAAGDLFESVVLERVDAAEGPEAAWVQGDLLRGPVVFRLHLRVLVFDGREVGVSELIGEERMTALRTPAASISGMRSRAKKGCTCGAR